MSRAFFRITMQGGAYFLVPKRHILGVMVSPDGTITVYVLHIVEPFTIQETPERVAFLKWLDGAVPPPGKEP
jgi:hypothetical protein